jgi:probable HAF family extracellular repeat protein
MPASTRTLAAALALTAVAPAAHAQGSTCSSPVEERRPIEVAMYQMLHDIYMRPKGSKVPGWLLDEVFLALYGDERQAAPSGRWRPHFGKCDPVTDNSIYKIEQLFSPTNPNVSGSATGVTGGSAGMQARHAFGSTRADNETVVGYIDRGDFTTFHAFRWTLAGGLTDLGTLDPANNATRTSMATGVSADASVVVGFSQVGAGSTQHAFRWTSAGMVDLGVPAGPTRDSRATGVNAAGDVIVGDATFADGSSFTGFRNGAFRWTPAGFQNLGALEPGFFSIATAVSSDGNTIVGQGGVQIVVGGSSTNGSRAFRWTSTGGMQAIGPLPGHTHAVATAVSDNGKVVVGISSAGPLSYNPVLNYGQGTAFIWTASAGLKDLRQAMIALGFSMTGVSLLTATGITEDGQYIVGDATGPGVPAGETRPYIIKLCDSANGARCTPFKAAPVAADFAFATSSPTSATVAAGQSVTATLTLTPTGGFNQAVNFSCSGLPATTACTFAPASVTPNAAAVSTTVTISTTAPTRGGSGTIVAWSNPAGTAMVLSLGALMLVAVSTRPRRRLLATLGMIGVFTSCGGGGDNGGTTEPPPLTGGTAAGTYPIVITAMSGSGATTITKTLTITVTVTR